MVNEIKNEAIGTHSGFINGNQLFGGASAAAADAL
jgi:hypothetical protein